MAKQQFIVKPKRDFLGGKKMGQHGTEFGWKLSRISSSDSAPGRRAFLAAEAGQAVPALFAFLVRSSALTSAWPVGALNCSLGDASYFYEGAIQTDFESRRISRTRERVVISFGVLPRCSSH